MTGKISSFKSLWFLVCSVLLQSLNLSDFSVLHRWFVTCAVGVFQWGAEVETDDPAGTGPHVLFRPVPGLLVLLASPTLHPSWHPPEPGGSAPGDGTPPTVTRRIEGWAQRTPEGTIPKESTFMDKTAIGQKQRWNRYRLFFMFILKTNTSVLPKPIRTCWGSTTPQSRSVPQRHHVKNDWNPLWMLSKRV